jgi:hypothetical protein
VHLWKETFSINWFLSVDLFDLFNVYSENIPGLLLESINYLCSVSHLYVKVLSEWHFLIVAVYCVVLACFLGLLFVLYSQQALLWNHIVLLYVKDISKWHFLIVAKYCIFFQGKPCRIAPSSWNIWMGGSSMPATIVAGNSEGLDQIWTCDLWPPCGQHALGRWFKWLS